MPAPDEPFNRVRHQREEHVHHRRVVKSQEGKDDRGKGDRGNHEISQEAGSYPVFGEIRRNQPAVTGGIRPLDRKNEPQDEEACLEGDGCRDIVVVIPDETRGERDEGDEEEADDVQKEEWLVEVTEMAELDVVCRPESREDEEGDEVVVKIRQEADEGLRRGIIDQR